MTIQEFFREFRASFPDIGEPSTYMDVVHSFASQQPHLDVIRLDKAIIAVHGEYSGSMLEFVTGHYGESAAAFLVRAA